MGIYTAEKEKSRKTNETFGLTLFENRYCIYDHHHGEEDKGKGKMN